MANEEDLVPELGDFVTFNSDIYKTTTGIIIYRDGALIRIRPVNSTTPVIDFPLEPETGQFQTSLGVTEVLIHTKRVDPHFSKQLSVVPGERLELMDAEGRQIEPPATVFEVIATDEYDAIRLEDGRVLDFQFVGPQPPYALLRPRAQPESEAEAGNEADVEEEPEDAFPDIDVTMLPAALVEEIPSEERTYSDGIQREDMFVSLLTDHTPERQKDPKIMSRIYRLTDVMLAMKNSLLKRDGTGAPILGASQVSYSVNTLQEALRAGPVASMLPIAAVKKVLYTDDDSRDYDDVVLRNDTTSLMNALGAADTFSKSSEEGNPFITYINELLRATAAFVPSVEGDTKKISVDQDVMRSQIPPTPVQGFPKTGPAFTKDRPPALVPLMANALGTVTKTSARLLGPSRIRNPKTGASYVVAPADSAETVGHLLLSKELLDWRSPIRSNNLLWDMSNSYVSRNKHITYNNAFGRLWTRGDEDTQRTVMRDDETPIKEELERRAGAALQFNSRSLVTITDSLGLRNFELSEELMEPLKGAVLSGTKVWDAAFKSLSAAAIERLKVPSVPAVESISPAVWTEAVLTNKTLVPVIEHIKQKETTLKDYDMLLANDLYTLAGGTLGPFANGLLGDLDISGVEIEFKNETAREDRIRATSRENAKRLRASPDINKCVHVKELEKVRGIRDDSKRLIMLDKFVKKYSSGQSGNYILCGNCGKDLVCKHEVLLLNEYFNPGRAAAIHKQLLLDFAGPVFEGAYICKTCGQKIMEIEYDTHLEFDDEGRPLVGRNVIEVENDEDDEFNVALAANAEADIPFTGAKRKLYFQLRALFELCGLALNLDVYTRVVSALNTYIDAFVSTEEAYNGAQERTKAAAAKAQRRFQPVPYINFQSTQIIGAVGAYAVLEIQTNPTNIPISAPGCVLSRTGFPIDGVDPATAGTGALDYVACALASIKRDDIPWNKVFWSTETDMKRRVDQSKNTILLALSKIVGIQLKGMPAAPVPLEHVTQMYRDLLDRARLRLTAVGKNGVNVGLASNGDKLPPAFRPLQRMEVEETDAIGNVDRFQKNVESGDLLPIRKVTYERQHALNMKLVSLFHTAAKSSGVIQDNNPCSESVCCTQALSEIEQIGNSIAGLKLAEGISQEAEVLKAAATVVGHRDPAVSNTGTHIYVPWTAPQHLNVLPTPDETVYYKLFLKNCYRGRKYGSVHELNEQYKCRNCEFMFPPELTYLNQSEITETGKKQEAAFDALLQQREQIAQAAFGTQGVDINEQKFNELEDAIRNRKLITPVVPVVPNKFFDSLEKISELLRDTFATGVVEDWASLTGGMKKILQENRVGTQRLGALVDFSRRYDTLLMNFKGSLVAHSSEPTAQLNGALDILATMTGVADPHTVIRMIRTQFVVVASQVSNEYTVRNPPVRKWFPKVNRDHAESLKKIWEVFGAVTKDTIALVDDLTPRGKDVAITAFKRFADAFGPILHIWEEDLRPTLGFAPEEYTQALRWTLFTMLSYLVNSNSTFYQGSPSATVTAEAVRAAANWIVFVSRTCGNIIKKYVLTDEEIRSRVNGRAEKEKAMFIEKLDKQEQEMRKLELVKKKLKIGDWSFGSQNLFKYNKNTYDFERAQRAAMGLPEFTEEITGPMALGEEAAAAEPVRGMEEGVLHRAAEDEDEDAGEDAGRLHFVC
jgi:hypothetical protein